MLAELVVDRARFGLDIGGDDVLTHYQRRRRFDSVVLIGVTDGLNRLFSNDNQGLRLVRDVGLAAVNEMPPVKRFFMRHAMGLAERPAAACARRAAVGPAGLLEPLHVAGALGFRHFDDGSRRIRSA